jgi:hypothetical protein
MIHPRDQKDSVDRASTKPMRTASQKDWPIDTRWGDAEIERSVKDSSIRPFRIPAPCGIARPFIT